MIKCLSFVGTGPLNPARYTYQNMTCDSNIIQKALTDFFHPDTITLFVTGKARERNLSYVINSLDCPSVSVIDIPSGNSEKEMWDIFTIIAREVAADDNILLDITHSFRFLPFLAFLTSLYIREVTGGTISGILYGAYESGEDIFDNTGEKRRISPVINLTSFITLVDWMMAVRSFVSFADARGIRNMIQNHTRSAAIQEQTDPETSLDENIMQFAESLHTFTSSVQLARSIEGTYAASRVLKDLNHVQTKIASEIPPLGPVLGKISGLQSYAGIISSMSCWEHLEKERAIITYQVHNGLYLQAAELAREWMVSAVICSAGFGAKKLKENIRNEAETALHSLVRKMKHQHYPVTGIIKRLEKKEGWEEVAIIWISITHIRNDLAHCGMNEVFGDSRTLEKQVCEIPEKLKRFFEIIRG